MKITPAADTPTRRADPAYFTGEVWQEPIVTTPEGPPLTALRVHFTPGGRTHWHTHPGGQTLHVISGTGLVQTRGGPARRIGPGDTVWIPPGEEHWHGAAPDRAMTHIAVQAVVDGSAVTWLDPVTEEDYAAAGA
jgi:quercetin dioxygenase-like cupin family protein